MDHKGNTLLVVLIVIFAVAALGFGGFAYWQSQVSTQETSVLKQQLADTEALSDIYKMKVDELEVTLEEKEKEMADVREENEQGKILAAAPDNSFVLRGFGACSGNYSITESGKEMADAVVFEITKSVSGESDDPETLEDESRTVVNELAEVYVQTNEQYESAEGDMTVILKADGKVYLSEIEAESDCAFAIGQAEEVEELVS